MIPDPFLLIGLGNPGREYKDSRHNIGFMLIDHLAVRLNAHGKKLQSKAIVISTHYEERKIILAKPQTYMNLSGQSVQGLLHFYKVPFENLLVAHDDRAQGGADLVLGDHTHSLLSANLYAPLHVPTWKQYSRQIVVSIHLATYLCSRTMIWFSRHLGCFPPLKHLILLGQRPAMHAE